eukprot:TRINITY_DN640_c0_g1_i1.p1 TRINITY_DN640_c0_g1~~TRINITY_DN640_c0_g1_i1.p1  ORF type:complete len:466 (-),score=72.52 TRINITY_DN640_c0_g1_i1:248-1645(-)
MKGYGKAKGAKSFVRSSPFGGYGTSEVQGDPNLLVYVGNLTYEVQWQDLKDLMRQAGNVEFCKILTEDGTDFGRSTGAAIVRYSHPAEAKLAIATLSETELLGRNILVDRWTGGNPLKGSSKGGFKAPKGGGRGQTDIHGDPSSMVYVGNLTYEVKWQELKDHMRQAGNVEFCKILTEDGTDFGRSTGAAIVRYSHPAEAKLAIATLSETELLGRNILVDRWTGGNPLKGSSKGGFKAPKGGGRGQTDIHGDPSSMVYVGNLTYEVKWQELKDHMRQAGNVEFCKIATEDGTEFGRSKGSACVRYSTPAEARRAIKTLAETELQGRRILVDTWTSGSPGGKGSSFGAKGQTGSKAGKAGKGSKGFGKGVGKRIQVHGDASLMVWVGNLTYEVTWQDLKDHMKQAGNVEFCKIMTKDGTDRGKSTGAAIVRYSTAEEAENAIATLAETELQGRNILVDYWESGDSA